MLQKFQLRPTITCIHRKRPSFYLLLLSFRVNHRCGYYRCLFLLLFLFTAIFDRFFFACLLLIAALSF